MRLARFLCAAGLALVLPLNACGDDSGSSACEAAGRKLCERACACDPTDACSLTSGGSDGGSATLHFDSMNDCVGLIVTLGCSGGGSSLDYGACSSALDSAMCVDAAGGQALASPAECSQQ